MMVSRETPGDDTVLARFLAFMAAEIDANPERLKAMDTVQQMRLQSLTAGVEVDLDQPLGDLIETNEESDRKTL